MAAIDATTRVPTSNRIDERLSSTGEKGRLTRCDKAENRANFLGKTAHVCRYVLV